MTNEDLEFIEQNQIYFVSIADGYSRHIDHITLSRFEQIYKTNLDPNFVLTKWCGACVFDMMKRLLAYYNEFKSKQIILTKENANISRRRKK